ncbi:MAG: sugar phosphate isomerase/epimerase [Salegentibacter sp.]|uniref:Sugar phosphate isomerase/epimerase n=1 Tax=Salegentibacter flavus TaxID=287099 RepID=A0A1I5CZ38_9FLAO|nr:MULTISPECIES: sugar phosphate isomerase/epimerase [Salegentibacter]MDR9458319.1 sugar phosphate isomerase/epimerase [Salegentibacter sp.]SFN92219.1 Sugar phosphate isomerase/epimerase [Salegentibacter flavus]
MIPRRTFLKQTGLVVAATTLTPSFVFAAEQDKALGLQLYSLRNLLKKKDLENIISKISQLGIKEIETYGYSREDLFWGHEAREFKHMLSDYGLNSPSGHYSGGDYLTGEKNVSDFKYILDAANDMDQKYVIIPSIPGSLQKSTDGFKQSAEKLSQIGEMCRNQELKLAYHNHAFEFKDFNGKNGMEIFLTEIDKDLIDFELDIYWVVRAGIDPISLFKKYPGRFKLWHIKDMMKIDESLNTEIGAGSIDYKEIMAYTQTSGLEHLIIEQENFEMDPFKSLSKSYTYIQNNLLK